MEKDTLKKPLEKPQKTKLDYSNKGIDTNGNLYEDIEEMWKKELGKNEENSETVGSKEEWYAKALEYWKGVKNDYNGVLGGLAHISGFDIMESTKTLNILKNRYEMGTGRCLDCGAGVGRITKDLHTEFFDKTDLLEPEEGFITKA